MVRRTAKQSQEEIYVYLTTFKGITRLGMTVFVGADNRLGKWCSHVKLFTATP
jgi:hypothetical protein